MTLDHAHLLCIGNELLIGRTVNTNATWLGQKLTGCGLDVRSMVVIPDVAEDIVRALDGLLINGALVVITGGLGATLDDITRKTLAQYFGTSLTQDPETLARMEQFYASRGRTLSPHAAQMANVPVGFTAWQSQVGAAPGLFYEAPNRGILVAFPGVPAEMKHLTESYLLPYLSARPSQVWFATHTFRLVGVAESVVATALSAIETQLPAGFSLAYNPSGHKLDLRLSGRVKHTDQPDEQAFEATFNQLKAAIETVIGKDCYGTEDQTLEGVVGQLLNKAGLTLGVAESCTGGAVAAKVVSVPGASAYFRGGVVAYDNAVKTGLLHVPEALLSAHGAVSEAVAIAMATGIRQATGSNLGVATTGIAGPTGATDTKPLGTVFIGYDDGQQCFANRYQFEPDRARFIERTVTAVLQLVWQQLRQR